MADNKSQVQVLWRTDPEIRDWLKRESESSGRPVTWLVNHAVELWKDRLEKSRKRERV